MSWSHLAAGILLLLQFSSVEAAVGGELTTIKGVAPLSELSDCQTQLKPVTGGQGSYFIAFSHYAPVSPHPQACLVSKHKLPVEEE